MRRAWLPLLGVLLHLMVAIGGGCAGREPRFDLVPPPVSVRLIWSAVTAQGSPSLIDWPCIDAAHEEYLRQYLELVHREATPLVRGFRDERGEAWRRDPQLIERLSARHWTLIEAMARLDEAIISQFESCGLDEQTIARLRSDREIERCRVVIEGHGAAIIDLRRLLEAAPYGASPAASLALMDSYAADLAQLLPALRDAERLRLPRQARALARLEAEQQRLAAEQRTAADQLLREAQSEAALPVRRAMAAVLDLNVRTLESLRGEMPSESHDMLSRRFEHAIDLGVGGASGDPVVEWQLEVIASATTVSADARAALRERIAQFRERDRVLREELVKALRRGDAVPPEDARRRTRTALRNEALAAALRHLPKAEADRLSAIRHASAPEFDSTVWALAPVAAEQLLARAPAGLRPADPEEVSLPQFPGELAALFLPTAANEVWLRQLLDRCRVSAPAQIVAMQLWTDHAGDALRALEQPMAKVREHENGLASQLRDPVVAGRAIDAYFAAVEEVRRLIAAIEERFFDELDPLLTDLDDRARERLRLERRLERERVDWRFVPLSELVGLRAGTNVSAPAVVHVIAFEPHERAIAEEILRSHLADLVNEASGFRREGLALLRKVGLTLARHSMSGAPDERAMRQSLQSLAEQARAPTERHTGLHRAVLDEIAVALPNRALEIRRAWRRSACPELFLGERTLPPIVNLAERLASEDAETRRSFEARRQRWLEALDLLEERLVATRLASTFDQVPTESSAMRDRLREWPALSAAVAIWGEEHARFLRDLALAANDSRLHAQVDAWMRSRMPTSYWIAE